MYRRCDFWSAHPLGTMSSILSVGEWIKVMKKPRAYSLLQFTRVQHHFAFKHMLLSTRPNRLYHTRTITMVTNKNMLEYYNIDLILSEIILVKSRQKSFGQTIWPVFQCNPGDTWSFVYKGCSKSSSYNHDNFALVLDNLCSNFLELLLLYV